jgi:hypothetical protein
VQFPFENYRPIEFLLKKHSDQLFENQTQSELIGITLLLCGNWPCSFSEAGFASMCKELDALFFPYTYKSTFTCRIRVDHILPADRDEVWRWLLIVPNCMPKLHAAGALQVDNLSPP